MNTYKITIRPITTDDVDFMFKVENDPEVWAYSDNTNAPYTKEEIEDFCENIPLSETEKRMVIEQGEQKAGFIDLYDITPHCAMVAIIIYPKELRSAKIGKTAMQKLEEICKTELSLQQIKAQVSPCNIKSLEFFEKCGYTKSQNAEGYILKKGL